MSEVSIAVTNDHDYQVDISSLEETVSQKLGRLLLPSVSLDISIVDEAEITRLNESALEHEGATDVLSFPQYESVAEIRAAAKNFPEGVPVPLGDIVVSFPRARRDARLHGGTAQRQIEFYIQHSIMHLLGFHHE